MSVTICVARPAAGKTRAGVEEILRTLARKPFARVWVLVPGQLAAGHFKRRLAMAGGAVGVRVGTFQHFSKELLEANNAALPMAPAPFVAMLLRQLVSQAYDAGELAHLAPIREFPGFIGVLRDTFKELRSGLVEPAAFAAAAESRTEREMAGLYARFDEAMRQHGWSDPSELPARLMAGLRQHSNWLAGLDLLVVDGFDHISGAQAALLQQIALAGTRAWISLPGGEDAGGRVALRRSATSLAMLQGMLDAEVTTLPAEPLLPPEMAMVERRLFTPAPANYQPPWPEGSPVPKMLLEAYSPAAEAREVLRWVKARIVRDKLLPLECAIFVSDPAMYEPALQLAAREFGMPVHFYTPRPFLGYPVGAALQTLADLPAEGYPTGTLINYLRSPFFASPLHGDKSAVDELDELSRYGRVVAGWEQWQELFDRLARAERDVEGQERTERRRKALPDPQRVEQLRAGLQAALLPLQNFAAQTLTPAGWVRAFEGLLTELDFYSKASTEAGEKLLEPFFAALRSMVISEGVLGGEPQSHADFVKTLRATLHSLRLEEPREKSPNGMVLVAGLEEACAARYRAVALVGLGEGLAPKMERPDPFLGEAIRAKLGLAPMIGREQAAAFYQAFTRADEHLLISRAYLTENGEEWGASPYWKSIVEWLGKGVVRRVNSYEQPGLENAASVQEALFGSDVVLHPAIREELDALNQQRAASARILRLRRMGDQFDAHDGNIPQAVSLLASLFGPETVWSASALEAYGKCAFTHFCGYALRLDERLEAEEDMDASQVGSVYHLILERLFSEAANPKDVEALRAAAPVVAKQVFASAPYQFGFRPSALWEVQKKEMLRVLDKTLKALAGASQEWTPLEFEKKFGFGDSPAYEMETPNGVLKLRGSIDRVDRHDHDGSLRVMDYKTGSSMEKKEYFKGYRLQFVLYAMAIEEHFKLGMVASSLYWSISLGAGIGPAMEDKTGGDEMKEFVRGLAGAYSAGVRAGHFEPQPPDGGCPEYCPAARWCWHYVPKSW